MKIMRRRKIELSQIVVAVVVVVISVVVVALGA